MDTDKSRIPVAAAATDADDDIKMDNDIEVSDNRGSETNQVRSRSREDLLDLSYYHSCLDSPHTQPVLCNVLGKKQ